MPSVPERIEIPSEVVENLMAARNLPERMIVGGRPFVPQNPAGSGHKSVVWRVRNDMGRDRALKLALYEDYVDRAWTAEVHRAAKLEDHRVFARIEVADKLELPLERGTFSCVAFVEEWVDGISLEQYLQANSEDISTSFLVRYASDVLQALGALEAAGLAHDDLHSGNVMLARPPKGSFDEGWSVRIVDMGSLKPVADVTKAQDDLDHVLEHFISIYNIIVKNPRTSRRDRRVLGDCRQLFEHVTDPDPVRAVRDPKEILEAIRTADGRANSVPSRGGAAITTPFEYISSEHISDDKTFIELFAETPWLTKVASRDPCLLTGPRGCGKSTLFRWLSLRTQLARTDPDFTRFPIAGFYISCSTELEGRFSWLVQPDQAATFQKEIVHYFNLVLCREVVDSLIAMHGHQQSLQAGEREYDCPWRISVVDEEAVLEFVRRTLDAHGVALSGVSPLRQALDLIDRERWKCDTALRSDSHLSNVTTEAFLGDLCDVLVSRVPFFEDHRITFLVDDFTDRRIKKSVQRVLNGVIRLRRDNVLFKVSSEKHGMESTDSSGISLETSRELVEIDIGREYIKLSGNEVETARKFATTLLDNRLAAARYKGTAETLLGRSDWGEYKTLARALRQDSGRSQYHGLECIADLCSGDMSTLLLIYRRIFEQAQVERDSNQMISRATQHDAIRRVSADQVDLIRTYVPAGPEMHALVDSFGTLVGDILRDGREIEQAPGYKVPPTCPRVEVDGGGHQAAEVLDERLGELFEELVRRAIFIEMEAGRARRGHVQTLRWQLRRVYLPTFGAALTKNKAIIQTPAEFKFLLASPREACAALYERYPTVDGETDQLRLEDSDGRSR